MFFVCLFFFSRKRRGQPADHVSSVLYMHVVRLLKVLCDDIPGAAGDRSYLVLGPLLSSLYTGVASEERDKRLIEWILQEGKFGGRNLAEIKGPQSLGRQLNIHLKICFSYQ